MKTSLKILTAVLFLTTILLIGCKKDSNNTANNGGGSSVFNKKISETNETNSVTVFFSENNGYTWEGPVTITGNYHKFWNWNHDKLVSIENQYSESGIGSNYTTTLTFFYNDSGSVSEIYHSLGIVGNSVIERVDFSYNESLINEVRKYDYEGNLVSVANITYSNGKPVRIDYNDESYKVLTWSGNNITKIETFNNEGSNTVTYTYDNHMSPFYGGNIMTALALSIHDITNLSMNNILTINDKSFSYEYFENYPTESYSSWSEVNQESNFITKEEHSISTNYTYLTE